MKKLKKDKAGISLISLIIAIVVLIIIIGVVSYLTLSNKKDVQNNNSNNTPNIITNNTTNNTSNTNSNISQKISNWDDYSLFIDGNEIKLPIKFSDFEKMGFYEMDKYNESVLNKIVKANSSYGDTYDSNKLGNIYGLFTNGKTSNINIVIYNNSNEDKQVKDCYITKVGFEIDARNKEDFIIGNVKVVNNTRKVEAIIGKTKYEDIESKFGPHYQYDYTNTLSYCPDSDGDGVISMKDLSVYKTLHMYFDDDTRIFEANEFYLYDTGNLIE